MRVRTELGPWILATMFVGGIGMADAVAAAEDCGLGARYAALAEDRIAAYENDEAVAYLKRSVTACPRFELYVKLADLASQSPDPADKATAVEALIGAHASAQSDVQESEALFRYAALLAREGDPQNAYPLATRARILNPGDAKAVALEKELEERVRQPKAAEIVRGLRDSLYRPLRMATRAPRMQVGPPRAPIRVAQTDRPSINIPINFEVGSVELDSQSVPNVRVLVEALSSPSLVGRQFVFIGHADVRGDEAVNLDLSQQRALAMLQLVESAAPQLRGRIRAEGRGEAEPLDPGGDDRAHRANRRLQVTYE